MEPFAVTKFREYIRIKTVHPDPDYDGAIAFLDKYAEELGLECRHVKVSKDDVNRTIVIMTWKGRNPNLKSILLNSHTDVVPVYEDQWKCDAFAAIKDENGDIYGRGTQDMKCVGIQYLEAIRRLKKEGKQFERDIHLTFVPEEELGGEYGAAVFFKTKEFSDLNIGMALDEGLANEGNKYTAYYGERSPWWIRFKSEGNPGHGSRFIENTAAEKLMKLIDTLLNFREEEKVKFQQSVKCNLGDATTVNLTKIEGGLAYNIVPAELSACFDIRIPPTVDLKEFEGQLTKWCESAGQGVSFEFVQKTSNTNVTSTDANDPWWKAFTDGIKKLNIELTTEVFSGATDSRFLRAAGYPAIGFSPMRNTPIRLHDHNEFLNETNFMEGIDAYYAILPCLADVPSF
uniref:N-acyl-aliphatic-L-amino acid amidohydrolase n=1 Tax=Phallusia mammillata TaxID=59560 RepID=A0A6F9D6B8_9ASCI|nr:aminoacylase-1 [Phallusia mammillata]